MLEERYFGRLAKWGEHIRPSRRMISGSGWVLFILPFVVYLYYVFHYAVNTPNMDDFGILEVINGLRQEGTLGSKLKLLFSQHGEHRIVFVRTIFLVQYFVFGTINFKVVFIIGCLGWILTVLVLAYVGKRRYDVPLLYLLPIPFLLNIFTHWQESALAAITNYWVILFSVLQLYCLAEKKTTYACLLFPLALFSTGAGLVLYPLGNLYLLVQKRWKDFTVYFIVSTLFVGAYFYDYQSPLQQPSVSDAIINLEQILPFFFTFLGSMFQAQSIALLGGFTSFVLLIALALRGTKNDHFLYLMAVYLILIAATISLSRSSSGLVAALATRYSMYSLLSWVCIYLWANSALKNRVLVQRIMVFSLTWGMLFFVGTHLKYQTSDYFEQRLAERMNGLARLAQGDSSGMRALHPLPPRAIRILLTSEALNVYTYRDKIRYRIPEEIEPGSITSNSDFEGQVGKYDGGRVVGWAFTPGVDATRSKIFILLADGKRIFKLKSFKNKRPNVSALYDRRFMYDYAGYDAFIAVYDIPAGRYTLGILVEHQDKKALHWEDLDIVVP